MITRDLTLGARPDKHYTLYVVNDPYSPYEPVVVCAGAANSLMTEHRQGLAYRRDDDICIPQYVGHVRVADLVLPIRAQYNITISNSWGSPHQDILADYALRVIAPQEVS